MSKTCLLAFSIFCAIIFLSNADAPFPENTGAPNELTCGRSPCHNATANIGTAEISIKFSNTTQIYHSDSTYQITVKITNPQTIKNGFQILALDGNNQNVGDWELLDPDKMKIISGIGLPSRKYITHKAAGNQQSEWTVAWKAPSADMNTITFFASVNSSNNNGLKTGDEIYTTSHSIEFSETTATVSVQLEAATRVYPVPASLGVWLDLPKERGEFNFAIYSTSGNLIRQPKSVKGGQHYIELQDISNGLYFLKVQNTEGQFFTKKLVVQ